MSFDGRVAESSRVPHSGYIRENATHLQQVRVELQPSPQPLGPRPLPSPTTSIASPISSTSIATSRSPQLLLPWPALIPPPHLGVPARQDLVPRKLATNFHAHLPLEYRNNFFERSQISKIWLRQGLHWLKDPALKRNMIFDKSLAKNW